MQPQIIALTLLLSTSSMCHAQSNTPSTVPAGGKLPTLSLKSIQFPIYLPIAKSARLESDIKVLINIDYSGSVNNVEFVDGKKQLYSTVLKALSHWRFSERLINGIPVEFHFVLSPVAQETIYRINYEETSIVVIVEAPCPK